MDENLNSTLEALRSYVSTHALGRYVSLQLEEPYIRITLVAEGRDLWLGRRSFVSGQRHFLVADRAAEPRAFFELNEATISSFLSLPSGTGAPTEAKGESHFLFVSYSRDDESLIVPIVDLLRLTDTRVFRDRDSIRPGEEWRTVIQDAIHQSTECLVFWCVHSATSSEVRREMELAFQLRKRMIPILLDDSPLDGGLQEVQAIDMRRFQPHPAATRSPGAPRETRRGFDVERSASRDSSREAAAAYLENRLADLLSVEPLRLIG